MMDTIQKNSRLLLICLLLVLVTLATFRQVKDHAFINFDDQEYVYENPQVQAGLTFQGIKWAFTTSHAANWHPLTWLSHMLDCQLFGLKPAWHHLMNLFFHIASTLLLFLVLNRMTKAVYQSAFVAALFALHPLHVESVAWVAERKDVLSAFFWMLTMGAYAHYAERPAIRRYLLVLLFFVLGLMSKPMLVTLPFVLLLMDYWPLGRMQPVKPVASASITLPPSKKPGQKKRRDAKNYTRDAAQNTKAGVPYQWSVIRFLVLEKAPLFAFSAVSSAITFYYQQKAGTMLTLHTLPLATRIGNALISYVNYMAKMICPMNLAVFYPHPVVQSMWHVLGAGLVLAIITMLVIYGKRFPCLAVGWFWFMGTLAPVIGIVQVGLQAMADRYTYIPFVGLFIMVAWGAPELLKKWRFQKTVLALSAAIILIACTTVTYVQLQYWRNSITLFRHALSVTKNNHVAHNVLGDALFQRGNTEEAISHFQEAIRIYPYYSEAYYNLGNSLFRRGKITEAESFLRGALRIITDYAELHYLLGSVLASQGNIGESAVHLREALRIKPDYIKAHNDLGNILVSQGLIGEAIDLYAEAIRLNPNDKDLHNNMGKALFAQGRIEDSIAHFRIALQIKPTFAEAHYNLGSILASQRMFSDAVAHFQEAVRIMPEWAKAHNNLGNALLAQGKIEDAIAHFQEALRIQPEYKLAQENLKDALRLQGK